MDEANSDLTTERAIGPGLDNAVLDHLLQKVVVLARHTVGGAHSVSITVADNGGYRTSNFTGEQALAIDEAQYAGDDGPCLRAVRSGRQVHVTVGVDGDRWPPFDEKAGEAGMTSVLSTPLIGVPERPSAL